MAPDLMTKAEIHDFGIEVVVNFLKTEGHEIVDVNTDLAMNPQVVAKKNGKLEFVVVRTACYPSKGQIENDHIALHCIERADSHGAACYFASVGIANSSGDDGSQMSVPVRGAGFYVAFDGLEILTTSDRVHDSR